MSLNNKVQLIGRLGQEPEIFTFDNGDKKARFSLATRENYKDRTGNWVEQTYWHNIIANGYAAKKIETSIKKGEKVALEGKLTNRTWDDKEGRRHYITEVMVFEIISLEKSESRVSTTA